MAEPIISARNLTKYYKSPGLSKKAIPALEQINLDIFPGEIIALLGPNGAGKTTFLRILFGLIYPTSGEVLVFSSRPQEKSWKNRAGYVPEHYDPPKFLTGYELLEIGARVNGLSKNDFLSRLEWLEEALNLKDILDLNISQYSRGMLQQLALAGCFIHNPELIVLDEPTANLDALSRKKLQELLWEMAQENKTILISSHILSELEELCNKVILIDKGKIIQQGYIKDLLTSDGGYTICFKGFTTIPQSLNALGNINYDPKLEIAYLETRTEYEKDRAVKILTENEVSIEFIEPKQKTLEEYFLEILEQKELEKYFLKITEEGK